ncbi:PFL_4669 family integrating conjugative element protein [Solimonas sp. SE-A11]|uniref:PFL_4669 family integrating conjugative element protein n=1 Tax=Solimonas sp. SE-A11 TaxID=3054954 RepID=UPI00259CDD33|nr:TIGR03761 family integrating conjugative element protein [Solimonas sp. SE-A11]MDM4770859.1 TIGR03761 family integrating conjugative element protein [Solimonas sp. SE-A11]
MASKRSPKTVPANEAGAAAGGPMVLEQPTGGDDDDLPAPGALRSETWLTIQTRQAQRLVQGRRAEDGTPGIIGLTRYAAMLRPIWNGARTDDPYADWWLVKLHEFLEEAWSEMGVLQEHVNKVLLAQAGVDVQVAQSVDPIKVPLTFSNPFAFRGAYLLAKYDELVRTILTARHVALLDRDAAEKLLHDGGRLVRRVFTGVIGYSFLGINREDIRLMTAKSKQAEDKMGKLPAEVLSKAQRAPNAPAIATVTGNRTAVTRARPGIRRPVDASEGGTQPKEAV